MNISPETRAAIIKGHRSAAAKKAAKTMRKKYGADYFKKQAAKGGSKSKRKARQRLAVLKK